MAEHGARLRAPVIEQLDLTGGVHVVGLTGRQQHALETVERLGGASIDEVGAAVHAFTGRHQADSRCKFCSDSGSEVLYALRQKSLVERRPGGRWVSTRALESEDGASGAATSSVSSGPAFPLPRARSQDPATSHAAAASVTDLSVKQQAVMDTFRACGPMTDEELLDNYPAPDVPVQTDSGLRTRRHELVEAGLIEDSGETRPTRTGRAAVVWQARADGIPF